MLAVAGAFTRMQFALRRTVHGSRRSRQCIAPLAIACLISAPLLAGRAACAAQAPTAGAVSTTDAATSAQTNVGTDVASPVQSPSVSAAGSTQSSTSLDSTIVTPAQSPAPLDSPPDVSSQLFVPAPRFIFAPSDSPLPRSRRPLPAHGWLIDGNADTRYRNASSGRTGSTYLNDGELDLGHALYWKNQYEGNFYSELITENTPDRSGGRGRYNDLAFGETYIDYRLPFQTQTGSTAYVRIGQFDLPVGLLPVYDTHLQVLQTLAPLGIGERVDWGAEVLGRFNGVIDYRFAATAGTGADHIYGDPNRVISFRLARLFATRNGVVNFGASLLSGRLPVTEVDPGTGFAPILPPSGKIAAPYGYINKSRLVGDATWNYRAVTARGEAMSGSDGNADVNGYFTEGEYRFAPGLSAVLARTYWYYGKKSSTSTDNAIGLDVAYGNNLAVRFLYEADRDIPYLTVSDDTDTLVSTHLRHIFTVQTLVRF